MLDAHGLYARRSHDRVIAALSDTRVVVLNGARQTGKSTLARLVAHGRAGTDPAAFVTPRRSSAGPRAGRG
ncbi:MAG: hypothetical protein M3291_09175, partial [Actinomycetota bacterium]|nr:hypothetical protein [Actinomycetota bacterium]